MNALALVNSGFIDRAAPPRLCIAGELLALAAPHLERNIHPIQVIAAYKKALEDALAKLSTIAKPVNVQDRAEMLQLVKSTLGTKFVSRWSDLMCNLALDAVKCVAMETNGKTEVDIKRYARIEKVRFLVRFLISLILLGH